jgi:branched-chain amino acid transport system ATP-binding protein
MAATTYNDGDKIVSLGKRQLGADGHAGGRAAAMSEDYILVTERLGKSFGDFAAVSDVDLRVKRGSIHALIGPNGAGKTTCFNMLTKFVKPTSGRIFFNNRDITGVALQRKRGDSFDFWRSKRVLEPLNERAMALLADVGLADWAGSIAVEISYGRKRALEIATTLALDPEMLLLDEPMAGMGHEDIDRIAALIRRVSANRTILMVEHNLQVVANLSDRITVLTRGRVLAEGDYKTVSENAEVKQAYLGVGNG